jgi:hypothetical protein
MRVHGTCTCLRGVERRDGAPHISRGGARGNVQQGLSGQRREEITEHRLILSNPLCISRIWLLDGLAVHRCWNSVGRLHILADQEVFQLRGTNCRYHLCLPQGVVLFRELPTNRDGEGGGDGCGERGICRRRVAHRVGQEVAGIRQYRCIRGGGSVP